MSYKDITTSSFALPLLGNLITYGQIRQTKVEEFRNDGFDQEVWDEETRASRHEGEVSLWPMGRIPLDFCHKESPQ